MMCTDVPSCGNTHLDDDGICAGACHAANERLQGGKLLVKDQDVERHVALDPTLVHIVENIRQLVEAKVGGTGTGVETFCDAKVDRVGPVLHGCLELGPPTRRRQHLGFASCAPLCRVVCSVG